MSANLFDILFASKSDLNRPLLQLTDGTVLSYEDCVKRSAQFANVLTQLGVVTGDRVAVQIDKSSDALCLYLACLRAGAVFLPLNTGYVENEIRYFLSDAKPRLLVCRPQSLETLSSMAKDTGVSEIHSLGQAGDGSFATMASDAEESFDTVAREADDLAAILYTSGTTGRSKGAMITHGNLASNAKALVETWRFSSDDVLIHALPIFHVHGLFVATNVCLLSGGQMIFMPGFDADSVLNALPNATAMMGVPTFYSRLLLLEAFGSEVCRNMRLFVSGSAPLSADIHKEFKARTGHAILERYGMTETGMITSNPYDKDRIAGTVGFPLPGVEIRIADRNSGEALDDGEVGVIEVMGANVFKGYWEMPEKTKAEFRDDGYFITGDLGMIDTNGYLKIVGRDKDLIISGGYNVYPAEVEGALDDVAEVAESAVIGVPHSDFGEAVTAVLALKRGASLSEEEIRTCLTEQLAKYKVPKRVFFVEALPRNTMGKIEKTKLRDQYADAFSH